MPSKTGTQRRKAQIAQRKERNIEKKNSESSEVRGRGISEDKRGLGRKKSSGKDLAMEKGLARDLLSR